MVVRHHLPQVRVCYDRALKQNASLAGIAEIRFAIDETGKVESADVHRNTTGHEGLGKCLAVTIKRWRFPRPVGGSVEFIYPFVFSSGD
jgi:TonB family protein